MKSQNLHNFVFQSLIVFLHNDKIIKLGDMLAIWFGELLHSQQKEQIVEQIMLRVDEFS